MKHIIITSLDMYLMGGVERTNASLCRLFSSQGHKVTLISFFRNSKKPFFDFGDNKIVSINNSPHGLNQNFLIKLKTLISFFKCINYLKSIDDDYILISSYPRTSILFAIFFSKKDKVIAHEHSSFKAHGKFLQWLRFLLYRRLRCVITLTEHDREIFKKNGTDSFKIPTFSDFNSKPLKVRDDSEPFVCLSAGRLHPHKGFDRLIEIANELKSFNIEFQIVGSGTEKEKIQSLISKYALNDMINLYDATDNLEYFFHKSDVYLMTSTTEAAPLVLLESLSFSKPIIAYDCPIGPREIIDDGVNGYLIQDGDKVSYVQKLKLMMSSPEVYNSLSLGASNYSKTNSSVRNYHLWKRHF